MLLAPAAVRADEPLDLGVLLLHVLELRRQRVGLLVDRLQLRLLLGGQRLQRAHVRRGDVQLVGVKADRGQRRDQHQRAEQREVAAREREPVHAVTVGRDDLEQKRLARVVHDVDRPRFGDGGQLFVRRLGGGLEPGDGLAVRARLLARVDAAQHHAVAVAVEQRQRVRQVGADVVERVVAHEADPRHLAAGDLFERVDAARRGLVRAGDRGVVAFERGEPVGRAARAAAEESVMCVDGPWRACASAAPRRADGTRSSRRARSPTRRARPLSRSSAYKRKARTRARWFAAHGIVRLPLLPSGPGGVHGLPLREAQTLVEARL